MLYLLIVVKYNNNKVLSFICLNSWFLILVQKQKKRAEGYDEGDYTLFRSATVSDFLQAEQPLDILSLVNEVCWELDLSFNV